MAVLSRVLPHQATKAMTVATRRGENVWVFGSTGEIYKLTAHPIYLGQGNGKVLDPDGRVMIECTCKGFEGWYKLRGECKHAPIAREALGLPEA